MEKGKKYGHIDGVPVGTTFPSRLKLLEAGVHGQLQAGIHGSTDPNGGAFSICLSDGYEDDQDRGETITYVGSGGQDSRGDQVKDQSFDDPANQSLLISSQTKLPVRVIRGRGKKNNWLPSKGYRYDGLYVVDNAEMRRGKRGYNMCFFELRRIQEGQSPIPYRNLLKERLLKRVKR